MQAAWPKAPESGAVGRVDFTIREGDLIMAEGYKFVHGDKLREISPEFSEKLEKVLMEAVSVVQSDEAFTAINSLQVEVPQFAIEPVHGPQIVRGQTVWCKIHGYVGEVTDDQPSEALGNMLEAHSKLPGEHRMETKRFTRIYC